VPRPLCKRVELLEEELGDLCEVDRVAIDAQAPGIEAREVEQLARELRQAVDLLAHAPEKLAPRGVVEVFLDEQLEVAAEREQRRSELVRCVGDELAAGVLEPGETLAHALEGARELAELVGARVDDRLVELAACDALSGSLEPTDPPRKQTCAPVAEQESGNERQERRDHQSVLHQCDAAERVLDRVRNEDDAFRVLGRLSSLRVLPIPPCDDAAH
jgi:hypothetical protein